MQKQKLTQGTKARPQPNRRESSTSVGGHQGNWYVLIWGLDSREGSLPLGAAMTLRTIPSPFSVFDLAAAWSAGFREWAMLGPLIAGCRLEIESPADAVDLPGYDTLNRAWLISALLTLRGFGGHLAVAASAYSWGLIAGCSRPDDPQEARRDLPPFRGALLDYHVRVLSVPSFRDDPLGQDDADWIASNFATFNKLASESERFRFALESAVDWRYATDARSAIARVWSGIESLFRVGAELTYRIAVSAAAILEDRGEARRRRYESVRRLYGLRSRVVHGDALPDENIHQTLGESFDLLRELLLVSVTKGSVLDQEDLDRAIFE